MAEEQDNAKQGGLKNSERLAWLGFMLFFVIILAIYIARATGLEQDLTEAQRELYQTQVQLQEYTRHEIPRPVQLGLTNAHIQDLQRRGLARAEDRLRGDLMEHPELIPHEAEGDEGFAFRPDGIHVLNHRWVLANFEGDDAHGQVLLGYEVVHGNVMWEVIDSTLDY